MKTNLDNYKLTTTILLPYTTVQSLHVNYATSYYNFIHEKAIYIRHTRKELYRNKKLKRKVVREY